MDEDKSANWTQIRRPQLRLSYKRLFEDANERERLLSRLESEIEYLPAESSRVLVFGRWRNVPRRQVGYGDENVSYDFSGASVLAKPWTETLLYIKDAVEKASGFDYNFVLINRYATGTDRIGEHRDDEAHLDVSTPIASVSFGATRDFVLRHGDVRRKKGAFKDVERLTLPLRDGDLLLMRPPTNRFWYHSLPSRKKCHQLRVSLTFRKIHAKTA